MAKIFIKKTTNLGSNDLEITGNISNGTTNLSVSKISNSALIFSFFKPLLGNRIVMRSPFDFNWTDIIIHSEGTLISITGDIWTTSDVNFPPTVSDSIFTTAPALSSSNKGTAVTSFATGKGSVNAGDWIIANINAVTGLPNFFYISCNINKT